MNQVILASHGELALGALDTIRMIVGEVPNVHAVILRRDDTEPITGKVEALIDGFADEDDVFVLTDMLGSSVNNAMVELMARRPRVRVVSGMNMPLVLTLVLGDAKVTPSELRSVIGEARAGREEGQQEGQEQGAGEADQELEPPDVGEGKEELAGVQGDDLQGGEEEDGQRREEDAEENGEEGFFAHKCAP